MESGEVARAAAALTLAGLTTWALVPGAIYVAQRTGFVDRPTGYKRHSASTPYLGGVAVVAGFALAMLILGRDYPQFAALISGAAALCALGTIDDRVGLGISIRLAVQGAVATALWFAGTGLHPTGVPPIDVAVSVLWIVGLTNALNLFDNQDGAAATIVAGASVGLAAMGWATGFAEMAIVGAALAGACIGFLRFNLAAPARIFLGDGGSLPLGFLLAAGAASILPGSRGPSAIAPFALLLALPIFDTTMVVVSRLRRNVPVLQGGRDHLNHRLARVVGTPRAVAMLLFGLQLVLGGGALAMAEANERSAAVASSLLAIAFVVLIVGVEFLLAPIPPRDRPLAIVAAVLPMNLRVQLAPQIHRLLESGYDVDVVSAPTGTGGLPGGLDEVRHWHTIEMQRSISPLHDVVALRHWIRLLRQTRPDVIIGFSPKAAMLGMLAGMATGVPIRIYSSGGLRLEGSQGLSRRIQWAAEWLTCLAGTRTVVNSPSLAALYRKLRIVPDRKLRYTVSRSGVDAVKFSPTAVDPAPVSGPANLPVVGFVGRLTGDKGLSTMADAAALLGSRSVCARWLLVGPSEPKDADQLLARLRAATDHMEVVGLVSDVRPFYAAMDVLVLPSVREGFPNVVLEAAAMGTPTVVTDATGCIDSVAPGVSGVIIPVGDAEALADALEALLTDESGLQRLRLSARQHAIDEYQPAKILDCQMAAMGLEPAPCAASSDT